MNKYIIESLLFIAGQPVSFVKLSKITKSNAKDVENAVLELQKEYQEQKRGMQIIIKEDKAQMTTSSDFAEYTKIFLTEDLQGDLSKAALETLAIIAYKQPTTRLDIDAIRGVNSSIMLRNLLIRGLVDRQKNKKDARMFEYTVSFDFMKLLGVNKKEDLPDYEKLVKSEALKGIEESVKDITESE